MEHPQEKSPTTSGAVVRQSKIEKKPAPPVSFWQKTKIVITSFLTFVVLLLLLKNWHDLSIDLVFKTIVVPFPLLVVVVFFTGYFWGTIASRSRRKTKLQQKNNGTPIKKDEEKQENIEKKGTV